MLFGPDTTVLTGAQSSPNYVYRSWVTDVLPRRLDQRFSFHYGCDWVTGFCLPGTTAGKEPNGLYMFAIEGRFETIKSRLCFYYNENRYYIV